MSIMPPRLAFCRMRFVPALDWGAKLQGLLLPQDAETAGIEILRIQKFVSNGE
jgi:hypothetical protein